MHAYLANAVGPMTTGGPEGWGGHMMNTPYGGLMMVLVVAAVVYFIVLAMRSSGKSSERNSPLDILNQRYAKGEIDKETYTRMREEIEGGKR